MRDEARRARRAAIASRRWARSAWVLVVLLAACARDGFQAEDPVTERAVRAAGLELELLAGPVERPLGVVDTGAPDSRLLIASQPGRILSWAPGFGLAPFLDLTDRVTCCDEQGLLGIAVHPDYARNGRLFVHYTDAAGDSRIVEYHKPAATQRADPASARELLRIAWPGAVNRGGPIGFGLDGMLYVGLGDGGSGARESAAPAQRLDSLLGKILRLDVDRARPYAVPPDNPWAGVDGARPEIWALGLRNPRHISFDRASGNLFVTDSAVDGPEEINRQPAAVGGLNYGWPIMQGSRCEASGACPDGLVEPILQYDRREGCAVVGGYRYSGRIEALRGLYLFADHCSGWLFVAGPGADGAWRHELLMQTRLNPVAFGESRNGELLLLDIGGGLFRLVATGR